MTAQETVSGMLLRYLANDMSHQAYYEWLADFLALPELLIPFSTARVKASIDPYLNDLPLPTWDAVHPRVKLRARHKGIAWSLSDTVCALKAMARRRRDRETVGVTSSPENG